MKVNNKDNGQSITDEIDSNIYMPKIKDTIITKSEIKKQTIIKSNKISSININESNKLIDGPNLFIKNKNINKDLKKIFNFDPKNRKSRGEYVNILNDERIRRGGADPV